MRNKTVLTQVLLCALVVMIGKELAISKHGLVKKASFSQTGKRGQNKNVNGEF